MDLVFYLVVVDGEVVLEVVGFGDEDVVGVVVLVECLVEWVV